MRAFGEFLAGLEDVPQDVDRLTAAHWAAWRMSLPPRTSGYNKYATTAGLLQADARLPQPVREAMARRFAWEPGREQAYRLEEFQEIRAAARRAFRTALLRIRENTGRLQSWRAGEVPAGSREWLVGEALDVLARTGDVPLYAYRRAVRRTHREALGGSAAASTWMRLFLSRKEAAVLAVLIVMELGLNATTVSELPVPQVLPGTGEAGVPVYRLRLEKRRRARHRGRFESRNLTDSGAGSSGRVITEALEATAAARAVVALSSEAPDRPAAAATPDGERAAPARARAGHPGHTRPCLRAARTADPRGGRAGHRRRGSGRGGLRAPHRLRCPSRRPAPRRGPADGDRALHGLRAQPVRTIGT
ncbi:hypothetical protein [Streptomyces rochei]|uniref:hypothetical protein n=1 Tax=Streptomyces rochei TaxID=1928 RepID=UPI00368F572B